MCYNQKKSPPTIFLSCENYGPQTCKNAEYVPYEDSYEEGLIIKNTDKFAISDGMLLIKCTFSCILLLFQYFHLMYHISFLVSAHFSQVSFMEMLEDVFGIGKLEASIVFGILVVFLIVIFIDLVRYKFRKRGI